MKIVLFGISSTIGEKDLESLIRVIQGFKSIVAVESLIPGNGPFARHYIATVHDSEALQEVVEWIRGLPGVDYASLPSERGLLP